MIFTFGSYFNLPIYLANKLTTVVIVATVVTVVRVMRVVSVVTKKYFTKLFLKKIKQKNFFFKQTKKNPKRFFQKNVVFSPVFFEFFFFTKISLVLRFLYD